MQEWVSSDVCGMLVTQEYGPAVRFAVVTDGSSTPAR